MRSYRLADEVRQLLEGTLRRTLLRSKGLFADLSRANPKLHLSRDEETKGDLLQQRPSGHRRPEEFHRMLVSIADTYERFTGATLLILAAHFRTSAINVS